jgi:hypothetical protein
MIITDTSIDITYNYSGGTIRYVTGDYSQLNTVDKTLLVTNSTDHINGFLLLDGLNYYNTVGNALCGFKLQPVGYYEKQ